MYKYRAYIRPAGSSTPLLETVQSNHLGELRAMAKAFIERLSISGDMPDGGFYHVRDMQNAALGIIEQSTLIRPLKRID